MVSAPFYIYTDFGFKFIREPSFFSILDWFIPH